MRQAERVVFPESSATAFVDSARHDRAATERRVCDMLMGHCTAELRQFNSSAHCETYMSALPMVYLENRSPVSRATDQTEDIKLVVQF